MLSQDSLIYLCLSGRTRVGVGLWISGLGCGAALVLSGLPDAGYRTSYIRQLPGCTISVARMYNQKEVRGAVHFAGITNFASGPLVGLAFIEDKFDTHVRLQLKRGLFA